MLRRSVLALARRQHQQQRLSSTMATQTPMEDAMRNKITESLSPTRLEIHNDSHLHSHHKAMAGSSSTETHFRVVITSAAFEKKMQPARHRMVYSLLKEEMAREGGIHALQLRTRTPEEESKQEAREMEEEATSGSAMKGGDVAVEK